MPYLSVVIPVYNEEKKISRDIEAVYEYFKDYKIDGELIVVNDGSKDKTYEVAKSYINKFPALKVITYEKNKGKGYAVKTGVLQANGEYILITDSGLCVPFKLANDGLALIKSGSDIALGSRRTLDNKATILIKQPVYRRLGSKFFQFLIQTFSLIPKEVQDTQCGFKLFRKEVAKSIFKRLFTEKFMWDIEVLRIASKEKYKIATFSVEWSNDPDTRFNPFIGSFENLCQIINIIIRT